MSSAPRDGLCSQPVCTGWSVTPYVYDTVKRKHAEMQPHAAGHWVGVSVPCFGTRVADTSSLAYVAAVTRLDCRRWRVTQRCPRRAKTVVFSYGKWLFSATAAV